MSDSLPPHGLYSPWNSPGQNTGLGSHFLLQGNLPNPGIKPRSPELQEESLPTEPQGKPKNTRVGSLSLLQRIFLTQESNWGLLHCRQILYQLSYCVDHNKLWKMLKEIRIPNHLTCLLRKLYVGQEATVRTRHRTTDWFQIVKGVCQGYILSACLFNLYAEYIMRNARLDES